MVCLLLAVEAPSAPDAAQRADHVERFPRRHLRAHKFLLKSMVADG